ncbi:MAG: nucleoside triphosphate pyrophosphohydrolase family protein [Candidatus Pacebacteria bacterium]|nr:nucleoside triphosphate pyrophosphohydrolase family protein [Candidatus Paceibacterota bacterium]
MKFSEYQKQSRETVVYPDAGNNYVYPTLGLAGEGGEIANKVKKIARDNAGTLSDEVREALKGELGDVLWYAAQLATELDLSLEDIAEENIVRLQSRKARGTLHGDGDTR